MASDAMVRAAPGCKAAAPMHAASRVFGLRQECNVLVVRIAARIVSAMILELPGGVM